MPQEETCSQHTTIADGVSARCIRCLSIDMDKTRAALVATLTTEQKELLERLEKSRYALVDAIMTL